MKAGFKVETRSSWYFDTVLVVTNYHYTNLVVNWPMIKFSMQQKTPADVGMWRIKQLKN